uniref:Sodium channel protein n=1 Tax=Haemonchus contortus TaxID=6289 RepID=A0A7I4YTD2_HAECO
MSADRAQVNTKKDEPGEDSGSFSPVETYESESVAILKDNVFYDEEQLMMLNKLTRSLMFRPMWKNRISAFSVMSGYILAFSTFARFCYFFDQYGLIYFIPFTICMVFIGIPLLYFELSLGQFTSLNSIVIFNRMVPISMGLGVSMTLLSILVTITDHLAIYSFVAVVGSTIQMNRNEMPWHSCANFYSSVECKNSMGCPTLFREDFFFYEKCFVYEHGMPSVLRDYAGECIRSEASVFYPPLQSSTHTPQYNILRQKSSTINYLARKIGMTSMANFTFDYPTPRQYFALVCVLAVHVFVSMRERSFIIKCCYFNIMFSYIMVIVFIVSIITTKSRQHYTWLWREQNPFLPKMWASAVQLTLALLRIGQSGLHSLGSQTKFRHNILTDATMVVMFVLFGTYLFAYAHILVASSGGLKAADYDFQKFDAYLNEEQKQGIYYQIFRFWTTMANLSIYGSYEPYVQWAISTIFALLAISSTFVWLELFVLSIVTTSNSLSDSASRVTLLRTTILCFALPFFITRSQAGFHAVIAAENTVIPVGAAVLVSTELLIVGCIYGFKRLWSNISSMVADPDEGDNIARRISGVVFMLIWTVTPLLIITALVVAYPAPHEAAKTSVTVLMVIIFGPIPLFAIFKTAYMIRRKVPLRALYKPDFYLWGPRNDENRVRAAAWEKKMNIRLH